MSWTNNKGGARLYIIVHCPPCQNSSSMAPEAQTRPIQGWRSGVDAKVQGPWPTSCFSTALVSFFPYSDALTGIQCTMVRLGFYPKVRCRCANIALSQSQSWVVHFAHDIEIFKKCHMQFTAGGSSRMRQGLNIAFFFPVTMMQFPNNGIVCTSIVPGLICLRLIHLSASNDIAKQCIAYQSSTNLSFGFSSIHCCGSHVGVHEPSSFQ